MPFTVRQTVFDDFEALADGLQDARSEIVQLGAGRMSGSMTHLAFGPHFGVSTGSFTRSIRARGVMSPKRWALTMMLESSGPLSAHHHKVAAGDLSIIPPGNDRYARFQDATRYSASFIDAQALRAFLASQPGAFDRLERDHTAVLAVDPETAAANVAHLRALLDGLAEHAATLSNEAAEFYQRNILELLTAPIRNTVRYRGAPVLSADRLVRDVDRYVVDAGSRPIHTSELCEHFKVNRRMLHRAFIEVVGIAPITFLRRKRLGDVHAALLASAPNVRIRDVAAEHGFFELGRFAEAYRQMFGELPSKTLRRNLRGSLMVLVMDHLWRLLEFLF